MKNVVAYVRVSTDAQAGEDRYGVEAQKEEIRAYAERKGLKIQKWYQDLGESGAKERPGFDAIVFGDVTNPPIDTVLVAKSDRVARDINVYYYYKMMLKKKDIELVSISEDFGMAGPLSVMLEAFIVCVAQIERARIADRTAAGRKIKASQGGYAGGRAPMGYHVVDGMLAIEPKEAELVRFLFEQKKKGATMMGAAEAANAAGFTNRGGEPVTFSNVRNIWRNEHTYRGWYRYGKDGEWVQGTHEPILKGMDGR